MDQTISAVLDDLEAGLKFTSIALASKRTSSVEKYRAKAHERYDRIITALGGVRPRATDAAHIKARLPMLIGDLAELGDSVSSWRSRSGDLGLFLRSLACLEGPPALNLVE
jgi:hypothetical protein